MKNKQYTECYIAFLDMLGFKKLIEKSSCEIILSIFEQIKKPYESALILGNETLVDQETIDALKIKVMSDSICFYIDKSMPNALLTLLLSCIAFQFHLLKFQDPILLRGAVVRGELYAFDDIMFGPGLTKAYLMEEHNAKFPRIIVTNEVLEDAREANKSNKRVLNSLDTKVLFRDFDAFYTLNIAHVLMAWDKDKKIYNSLMNRITQTLNFTTDESIREKHLYLEKVIREHYICKG